jgi:hypothetical protein
MFFVDFLCCSFLTFLQIICTLQTVTKINHPTHKAGRHRMLAELLYRWFQITWVIFLRENLEA